jgi:hemerythrin
MESPFIPWSESFMVGHKELDAEHYQLIEAINKICAAVQAKQTPNQLKPLLIALELATEDHFKHENSIMREISNRAKSSKTKNLAELQVMSETVINKHIIEHAQSRSKLESIIHTYLSGAAKAESTLNNNLKSWFLDHAIEYDAPLKTVFQAM